MKKLILPTENQVKKDIEQFLFENYLSKITIEIFPKYLKYVKEISKHEFSRQNIEFNKNDFFNIYNLYAQSDIFFKYLDK